MVRTEYPGRTPSPIQRGSCRLLRQPRALPTPGSAPASGDLPDRKHRVPGRRSPPRGSRRLHPRSGRLRAVRSQVSPPRPQSPPESAVRPAPGRRWDAPPASPRPRPGMPGRPEGLPHKSHRDENRRTSLPGATCLLEGRCGRFSASSRAPAGRQDFRSNRRLLAPATPMPSAQARKGVGWPTASASARRPPGARGGVCVMASRGRGLRRGKRRRENGGAGERRWRRRARGPGPCPRPQQGPGQRRPLRAAVVRAQTVNDGCSGRVGGRVGRSWPRGTLGAGARSRGSSAEQEAPWGGSE